MEPKPNQARANDLGVSFEPCIIWPHAGFKLRQSVLANHRVCVPNFAEPRVRGASLSAL